MAKFAVVVFMNGENWPLRGTVWSYSMERAQKFDSEDAARAQLAKAKPFMKASVYKKAKIIEVAD